MLRLPSLAETFASSWDSLKRLHHSQLRQDAVFSAYQDPEARFLFVTSALTRKNAAFMSKELHTFPSLWVYSSLEGEQQLTSGQLQLLLARIDYEDRGNPHNTKAAFSRLSSASEEFCTTCFVWRRWKLSEKNTWHYYKNCCCHRISAAWMELCFILFYNLIETLK